MFLEILQNSQESICVGVCFLRKLQAWPATLLRKWLRLRCFPVNIAKFARTPFLQNTSGRLFLYIRIYIKKHIMSVAKRFEHIPCSFSGNIFDHDWIWYIFIEYQLEYQIELFISVFSHLVRGWLARASNAAGSSCNRQGTFCIGDDNLKQIQSTNCDPT